jgi:hypothetical protein
LFSIFSRHNDESFLSWHKFKNSFAIGILLLHLQPFSTAIFTSSVLWNQHLPSVALAECREMGQSLKIVRYTAHDHDDDDDDCTLWASTSRTDVNAAQMEELIMEK